MSDDRKPGFLLNPMVALNIPTTYPIELRGFVENGALVITVSGHPALQKAFTLLQIDLSILNSAQIDRFTAIQVRDTSKQEGEAQS